MDFYVAILVHFTLLMLLELNATGSTQKHARNDLG
jgi:hypothetical protein